MSVEAVIGLANQLAVESLHPRARCRTGTGLRRGPDERVEMFGHENVSYDLGSELPPQLFQSLHPLVPETVGIKEARTPIRARGQAMQMIEAAIMPLV
jgi:hypothetical protein